MGYRYIGSKSKIIDFVIDTISEIVPHGASVADLMCGTASVSIALRKNNYSVIANDLMTYSFHHAVAGLKFYNEPMFSNAEAFIKKHFNKRTRSLCELTPYEKILNALSNINPVKGYFWREFSPEGKPHNTDKPRSYFSAYNAAKIDGIRKAIHELHKSKKITSKEYSLLIHDLLMAANDVANIAGTYGHYLSKLTGRANDEIELTPSNLLLKRDTSKHKIYQGYAEVNSRYIKCDLCYIDPPYIKRQYAANYHILETLARGDQPEAIGVSGLRPWRDQYSNFCTKTKIRDSFKQILENIDCKQFLISYSEDGLLTVDDIVKLFRPYGDVYIKEFKHARFRSNKSSLDKTLTEYLIHIDAN